MKIKSKYNIILGFYFPFCFISRIYKYTNIHLNNKCTTYKLDTIGKYI